MTAADRQTVSKLVAGDVIHVEREASGLLRSTTRKTKTIHATVTGRDSAPAGEFQQRGRFIVRTDQGDTISVPGHQTFGLVKGAGAPAGEVPAVEVPAVVPTWNEYDTWRGYALAGDTDAPTRGDMKPRTETFRGRRLKVTRGTSWGTIDMSVNGAHAGSTTGNSAVAMDRTAEQLRKDVLAADERRVTDPDAYPAVWFTGATELPAPIVAYLRDQAEREERDRAAMAATSCSDVEHVPGVMGCPLSFVDCNAVPFAADTIDVHEVRESTGMLGFDAAGLEVRAALVAQLPEVGALSTGETGWDHKRIRRAAVWQLPIGSHLVTFVHYEGRTAVAEAASFIAVLVDGRMVEGAGAVSAARRPAELSRFLAWTIASTLRTLDDAPAAVPAVEAPAAGDQGDASGDVETSSSVDEDGPDVDMCPDCGEDAYAPHSPDGAGRPCPSDPDTVTYADALAAAQGDEVPAPAAPSFSTWQELADHIRPGRTRLLLAGAGEQASTVDAGPIEAPAPVVPAPVGVALAVVNNARGSIRVHKPGCRDIEREAAGGTWWELSSPDVRGVVVDLYGNGDFEGFTLDTWRDWSGDVEVMPCAGTLPDVADNAPAAPVGDVTPGEAGTSGTGDLVPAGEVVRPQLGDLVSVSGWSGVSAFVLSVQQDTVGGWDTGETLRFPVGNVTAVTVPTLGDMRHTARLVLDSTARAVDIVEPARAILTTPTWESGTPKAGEGVRAVALNTTDGKRLDDVELLAHTVTKLGCGCWRIECHRPGPVQDGHRSTVALHTGCHRHDAQVSVPLPNADELAAARLAGREAHTLGVPAHIFTTSDERIGSTFKRLPVGSAVYSALITSYHEGYEQAAEHAVESAGYAAINTAGAEPAARNLEVRTAELAEAREVLAGDHTDKPAGSAIMDEVFAGLRAAVAAKSPADDSAAGPATTSVAAPDVRRTYKPQPWVLAHLAGGAGESGTPSEQEQQPTPAVVEAPPAAGDQVEGDEATSWAEFYTLTVEDYAPELPSDEADEHGTLITITHNHEDGTTLDGSSKGDGVYEIAHAHGFTYRSHAGIFIQGSRDRFSRLTALAKLGAALREAGHRVAFDIDDVWRPTAVREEARAERVSERVERLSARAGRKFGEGNGRRAAAEAIGDRMPFGEPIKVGHHSERAHRRAFERIDANYRAAYAAYDYAEHLTNRAEGAEANEEAKNRSRAIMRRIERIETDQRKYVRELGKLMESDPANRSAYRRRLRLEIERIAEEVAYQRAKLGDRAATGEFVAWSKGDFRKDDFANIGGTWCKVVRANAKTLSVENRYGWGGNGTAPYDKVFGRRRDGMQWDAPNAEPWSVEEARKAAKWEALTVRARRAHPGDGDQLAEAANQGRALRIVLGMAKDSGVAEVDAYGEPADQDGKRRRALAAWDVYERLTAGETFEQIAATIEPLGDSTPRWVMPEGEPQDVRVTDLVVGDVVVGIWDSGFAGSRSRLIYSMEGPVTSAPVTYDRYESGEWATFEVDGNSHDVKTFRLVSAHLVGDRN